MKLKKLLPIAALALLTILFFGRSFLSERRARRLERHREELMGDVGLLQNALLPEIPPRIGALETSVAYRPAEGPAAGGDFYDVFEMEGNRVAIIVGDVCGHGRQALAVTALMRYSLRAYLQAGGGEPRVALQIAARALEGEPHAELTTVVLAVYDGNDGTLTYACAGHEPPIVISGSAKHRPVTVGSSPPVGAGLDTGLRQTRLPLPPGAMACFFTDGLVEARLGDGLLGRKRLAELAGELRPEESAGALLQRIAERADRAPDDMAACIIRAAADAPDPSAPRVEELELDGAEGDDERARGFLAGCGMPKSNVESILQSARTTVGEFGGAILRVRLDGPLEIIRCRAEVPVILGHQPFLQPCSREAWVQRQRLIDGVERSLQLPCRPQRHRQAKVSLGRVSVLSYGFASRRHFPQDLLERNHGGRFRREFLGLELPPRNLS